MTRPRLVVSIAAAAFITALVAVAAAVVTIDLARPSDSELQRSVLDEAGIPPSVLDLPGAHAVADELTTRVTNRVIDESQPSIIVGATVGTLAGAVTSLATTIAVVRLRHREQDL